MMVWDQDGQCDFDLRPTDALRADCNAVYSDRCQHERAEIRRRISESGRVSFWRQCLTCGNCPGGQVRRADIADASRVPDFDDDLNERYHAERSRRIREVEQKHVRLQKAEKAQWWRWYDKYLQSTAWRLKRNLVMARAEGVCEGCRAAEATQVHHLTYEHVGNEFLWELVAICNPCHERMHAEEKQGKAA